VLLVAKAAYHVITSFRLQQLPESPAAARARWSALIGIIGGDGGGGGEQQKLSHISPAADFDSSVKYSWRRLASRSWQERGRL
jgi:hypothetical protein